MSSDLFPQRPSRLGGVALLALLCLVFAACSGGNGDSDEGESASGSAELAPREHHRERPPVVVIGVDGLTWNVIEPLLAKDALPNFQRLMDAGISGNLYTDRPTYSPMLWTSIGTGVKYKDHGIHYFVEATPEGRPLAGGLPYTSNSRKVPAIWNMAGEGGRTVDSVAWWVSWPAEHVPNSRIVASYAAQAQATILWKPLVMQDGLPELTYPEALQEQIGDILWDGRPNGPQTKVYNERFGTVPEDWRHAFKMDRFFRGVFHADQTHQQIFLKMLQEDGPADLSLVYYGLPDVAGHYFWRYRTPQNYTYLVPDEHSARLGDHIDKAYQQMDSWLGEILDALPEETIVMVISDHGMGAINLDDINNMQSGGHTNAPPGVMILAGPGVQQFGLQPRGDRTLGSIYDITPTLLDLLDLPSGSYMTGKPLRQLMTETWRGAHPSPEPKDWREGFRAATKPRLPTPDSNT
ncbi:MAG: alkaline phosphatase family protein, partial [Planctomycetota bacterium]